MNQMKRIYLAFLMTFFVCLSGFAQTEADASALPETAESTYWTDSTANNQGILNKSEFKDNWFIGLHAGTLYSWGTHISSAPFFKQFRPIVAISGGKWVAPAGGVRLQGFFGTGAGRASNSLPFYWNAAGIAVDGLFNFTNLFCGYKENRFFNLIGVLGLGYEHTWSYSERDWNAGYFNTSPGNFLALRLGLIGNFRLNDAWDINVEILNNWLNDAYDGIEGQGSHNRADGHLNILLGFTYHFKNHDGSRSFTYAKRDMSKYKVLNDEINRLREINQQELPPIIKVETQIVESNQVRTYISFTKNSSSINRLQEVNVYTTSENLKKYPESDLYITPTEPVDDTELFLKRAQAVRDVLVNIYNIPAGRIFIEKNPGLVQSLDPQKSCVILYINE